MWVPVPSFPLLSIGYLSCDWPALGLPAPAHERRRGSALQDQNQPWHDNSGILLPGRGHRRGGLARYRWERRWWVFPFSLKVIQSLTFCLIIASGTVKKVIEINPYLLGTLAGTAGTCISVLYLLDLISFCDFHS
jgi:hypothetical protein